MALPTTITSPGLLDGFRQSYVGPFISSGGNVYVFTQIDTGVGNPKEAQAWKATDPTSSFSEVDSTNRPQLDDNSPGFSMNCLQDGDEIHLVSLKRWVVAGENIIYARFDMSTDAWVDISGGAREIVVANVDAPSDLVSNNGACDIAVLSDGTLRVVAATNSIKDMGTYYAQIAHWESTDNGATWSSATTINGAALNDYTGPRIVLPPSNSDQCHIHYRRGSDAYLFLRSLSSGDTLRTEYPMGYTNLPAYPTSNILGFDRT